MSSPTRKKMERSRSRPGLPRVRLLLVGDRPRVRQSLRALLTVGTWSTPGQGQICIEIVGEAGDSRQAITHLESLPPAVILMDLPTQDPVSQVPISDSVPEGLALIETIKSRWPTVKIVVLTMYANERSVVLSAGADVFLLKGCPTSELLDAVTT